MMEGNMDIVKRLRLTDPEAEQLGVPELQRRAWDAADEIERLRNWVFCPEHGPGCGAEQCCCIDRHQPTLARWDRIEPGLAISRD